MVSLWSCSFGKLKEKGKITANRAWILSQLTGRKWQMDLSVGLEMVKKKQSVKGVMLSSTKSL